MLPPTQLVMVGCALVALAFSLSRPGILRLVGFSSCMGCAVGYGLSLVNNTRAHSFEGVSKSLCFSLPAADFKKISGRIYEHIEDYYNDLGQLNIGEEHLTVEPNVFAQIGVVDVDGIRKLWTTVIIPQLRMCTQGTNFYNGMEGLTGSIEDSAVFCDIGSGVGNVCLQVLGETRCRKVVGVEVIPSRHENAITAFSKARACYPEFFGGKEAVFIQDDLVNCSSRLAEEKVNVVFSHSWMFDDELMQKLTEVLISVPTVLCVVTSRELDSKILSSSSLELVSQVQLSADWNDQAPFYVYRKLI